MAMQQGIAAHWASCTNTWCMLRTYSIVKVGQESNLSTAMGTNIILSHLNESAAVNLPYTSYLGSISLSAFMDANVILFSADIDFTNLTCSPSLTYDEANDCTFLVSDQLTSSQLTTLSNFGLYAYGQAQPVTLSLYFQMGLKRALVAATKVPISRFSIQSFDPVLGSAVIQVLPMQSWDSQAGNVFPTLWSCSFAVTISSISQQKAASILLGVGILPVQVTVSTSGKVVSFVAANINVTALANGTNVNASTITTPVPGAAVLTHQEVAAALVANSNSGMMTVNVMDRTFWSIPSMTSAGTKTTPLLIGASSSGMSSGSTAGIAIGIIIIICLVAVVAFILYRRRRQRQAKGGAIAKMFTFDNAQGGVVPEMANPAFHRQADSSGPPAYSDVNATGSDAAHYSDMQGISYKESGEMCFSNPMYGGQKQEPNHYQSETDPVEGEDVAYSVPMEDGAPDPMDMPVFHDMSMAPQDMPEGYIAISPNMPDAYGHGAAAYPMAYEGMPGVPGGVEYDGVGAGSMHSYGMADTVSTSAMNPYGEIEYNNLGETV